MIAAPRPDHGAARWMADEIARLKARIAELEAGQQADLPPVGSSAADLIPLHAGRPGITAEAAEAIRSFT